VHGWNEPLLSWDKPWFSSHGEKGPSIQSAWSRGAREDESLHVGKAGLPDITRAAREGKEDRCDGWEAEVSWHKLELIYHSAKFGPRSGLHFPHNIAAMDFHRDFANADKLVGRQLGRDPAVVDENSTDDDAHKTLCGPLTLRVQIRRRGITSLA
jgi:hypothetical protein